MRKTEGLVWITETIDWSSEITTTDDTRSIMFLKGDIVRLCGEEGDRSWVMPDQGSKAYKRLKELGREYEQERQLWVYRQYTKKMPQRQKKWKGESDE